MVEELLVPPECVLLARDVIDANPRKTVPALSFAIEHKLYKIMSLLSQKTMVFSYEEFAAACVNDEDSAVRIIEHRVEQGSPVSFSRILPHVPLIKDKEKQFKILDLIESASSQSDMTRSSCE